MKLTVKKVYSSQLIFILTARFLVASAQYYGSSGYDNYAPAGESEQEQDDRPKVHLGFRLRVPAFRFELPRMNLPKITISAKIRQPDGPRTITLPEINLDTSSRLSPNGAMGGLHVDNGGGAHGPSGGAKVSHQEGLRPYFKASSGPYSVSASELSSYRHHQQQQQQQAPLMAKNEQEDTFTFSASDETSNNGEAKTVPFTNQAPKPTNVASYNSAPISKQSTYDLKSTKKPLASSDSKNYVQQQQTYTQPNLYDSTKFSDSGFNAPLYLEQAHNQLFYVDENRNKHEYQHQHQQHKQFLSPMMMHHAAIAAQSSPYNKIQQMVPFKRMRKPIY